VGETPVWVTSCAGVEGTYNTHDYLNERRAALETWTAPLLDIESGAQKITPIRRKAAG
jgi:hypothetical protein